jgi:hypothetical protein
VRPNTQGGASVEDLAKIATKGPWCLDFALDTGIGTVPKDNRPNASTRRNGVDIEARGGHAGNTVHHNRLTIQERRQLLVVLGIPKLEASNGSAEAAEQTQIAVLVVYVPTDTGGRSRSTRLQKTPNQ